MSMKPKCSANEGIIYPAVYFLFHCLYYLSLLTHIQLLVNMFNKNWRPSHRFVDAYILSWFFVAEIGSVVFLQFVRSPDDVFIYPTFISALLIWRLVDIMQRWWHVLFVPPYNAKVPRIIILTLINYVEIVIIFGVVGFLCKIQPYYSPPGEIQVLDGVRASLGILTPLGIPSIPQTWSTGVLFYAEYATGLAFLVVVINVVLSHLTNSRSESG
jgi:hypothetical protein